MLDRTINALAIVAGVLMCTLTVLICADVASRTFDLFAIDWTLEAAEYHLYAITFLTAPWVLRTGGHISVDLLVAQLNERVARRLAWCVNLVGAGICVVLLFYSIKVLIASYRSGTLVYKALIFPEWFQFTVPPVTFALMLLIFGRWLKHPGDTVRDGSLGL